MPKFKIPASLFEPITIEVEGGRTYESVPLSPDFVTTMVERLEQSKAGAITDVQFLIDQFAAVFAISQEEARTTDSRIIRAALDHVAQTMNAQSAAKPAADAPEEATAEKNVLRPEDDKSPQ